MVAGNTIDEESNLMATSISIASDEATNPLRSQELKQTTLPADLNNMDLSAIALQGLAQSEVQLNAAASTLASAGAASPAGVNLDVANISGEIVALNAARTLVAVNLSVLKTADQIEQNTINLFA